MNKLDNQSNQLNSDINVNLKFDGPDGIICKRYKEWLYWKKERAKDVKSSIHFPDYMLINFKYWKKYRIHHNEFFVKKISFTSLASGGKVFDDTELVKV
jgi:hypothetical protein